MLLIDIFRLSAIRRFVREIRERGTRSAIVKTASYINRRLNGRGLSGVFSKGKGGARPSSEYLTPVWLDLAETQSFHIDTAPALLNKRRKIAMIGDLNLAQCRKYRVEQLNELWHLADIDYSYAHYEDVPRCVEIMQSATHVMFYRLGTSPIASMLAYEARRLRLPILYDLDDPLFSVSAYGSYGNMKALPAWQKAHFIQEAPKYLDVLNASDLVSVSTPGMQAHTQKYTQRPVHVRRNFADRMTLEAGKLALQSQQSRHQEAAGFRLAFASGSQGHEIDFAEISDDIIQFMDGAHDRKLVILGHFDENLLPAELRGQVEKHAFTDYEAYLQTLASVDCAIMPLTDDIFNQCKSAVRVIDAASVGVPALVGTVSDMANMVDDGRTGFVVPTKTSWLPSLETLAQDRKLSNAMGAAARQSLEDTWSARLGAPILDRALIDWAIA